MTSIIEASSSCMPPFQLNRKNNLQPLVEYLQSGVEKFHTWEMINGVSNVIF